MWVWGCVWWGWHGSSQEQNETKKWGKAEEDREREQENRNMRAISHGATVPLLGGVLMQDPLKAPFSSGVQWVFGNPPE